MTTLVALKTKDALVMGCDSLGSVTAQMIQPFDLVNDFFDPDNGWKLKTDEHGKPILQSFDDIFGKSQTIPFNHMTHMTKLFSFSPLEIGLMSTGLASIGDRTIKSLVGEFKEKDKAFKNKSKPTNYTVKSLSKRFLNFVNKYYLEEYKDDMSKPDLEFMVGGYDKQKQIPTIYRILVHNNVVEPTIEKAFGISFGGQMQEIQRIVFGTDDHNRVKLEARFGYLFNIYRDYLQNFLRDKKIDIELPDFVDYMDNSIIFRDWRLDGFDANWGDFSEQNAIECVNFFVQIMIKSQQFSSRLPTVGGEVHVALITKRDGFKFVSREEYEHEGYTVLKEGIK